MKKRLKNVLLEEPICESNVNDEMNCDTFIQNILSTLTLLIQEYLQMIDSSIFMSTLDNRDFFSAIGMRMLFHIFQMNLIYCKNIQNIQNIFCNCQKSFYYYLEYLEQMKKTNALHCLNYLDAIQFVYNKTIVKNNDHNQKCDIGNINISINIFITKFSKISKFLFLLMWWENTNINHSSFDKSFLDDILSYDNTNIETLFSFIEKVEFDIELYQIKVSNNCNDGLSGRTITNLQEYNNINGVDGLYVDSHLHSDLDSYCNYFTFLKSLTIMKTHVITEFL
jgi:hypothetical protein